MQSDKITEKQPRKLVDYLREAEKDRADLNVMENLKHLVGDQYDADPQDIE